MMLDANKTFGEIYDDPGPALRQLLLELKQCTLLRESTQEWANSLRFISVPAEIVAKGDDGGDRDRDEEPGGNITDSDSSSQITSGQPCTCYGRPSFEQLQPWGTGYLRVTDPGDIPDCVHYVAVSYCWPQPETSSWIQQAIIDRLLVRLFYAILNATSFLFFSLFGFKMQQLFVNQPYVVRTASKFRHNRAPREILDRAINYAMHEGVRLIWIDQECIEQDIRTDKEAGIQSMDLVYQRAKKPVGLLNAEIKTQAHLDALLQLVEGEEFAAEQYKAAVEVLELLAQDRWLTRAWVFQEIIAAGETMELLIRCNPDLEKSIYLGRVPGEVTISVEALVNCLGWISSRTDNLPDALKTRAESATQWLIQMAPSYGYQDGELERNPELRFGCNGLQAFKLLSKRENSLVPDRLAIMGNLCNYPIRIDTHQVTSDAYSFSACALALALLNGDISFLASYGSYVSEERSTDPPTDHDKTFSWTPPGSVCFLTLDHFEALDTSCCRISSEVHSSGLLVSGWLWKINTSVNLSKVKAQYSSLWSNIPNRNTPNGVDSSANRVAQNIFWSIVRELVETGYVGLAQAIWASNRKTDVTEIGEDASFLPELPVNVMDVINPRTHEFILHQPPYINTESDAYRFFPAGSYFGGYGFIIRRILEDGVLWCGDNAIFDVDGPSTVFCPKCEGVDVVPRPIFFRQAISWCVEQSSRFEEGVEILEGKGMVRGLWTVGDREAERYIVA
jgi:Heterokaryon incompatibility protein (HET)